MLKEQGYNFDVVHTSMLQRCTQTMDLILKEMGLKDSVEVKQHWKINERHYGQLQGGVKKEMAQIHGEEQVDLWRQSYDNPPPPISQYDPDHPRFSELYKDIPEEELNQMP